MEAATFAELYRSDLQALYALCVVPGLFLIALFLTPGGRAAARFPDADVRFLWRYCVVFGVEAILVRPDFTIFGGVRTSADLPNLIDALRARLHLRSDALAEGVA